MTDQQAPMGPELTAREREVLSMVARGFTNREIGEALFISESTAGVHVSHIMAKLGVGSRTEAAAYAYRAGLIPSASDPASIPEPPSAAPPSVEPPPPAGWIAGMQASLRDQLRRHPRRVAAIGLGSVAVLAAITVGLAIAVLGAGRPVAGVVPSPTPSPTLSASPSPTARPSTSASPSPTASPTSDPTAPPPTSTPTAVPTPHPAGDATQLGRRRERRHNSIPQRHAATGRTGAGGGRVHYQQH